MGGALVVVGAAWAVARAPERPPLGLFATLPIYWGEAADVGELLQPDRQSPWLRTVLERQYDLIPLDTLAPAGGDTPPLSRVARLLMAQPRALSGAENVALDRWVRDGGQLLLFADPMLTGHSRFAIGDRRRRQDVVLLSPILARWGLALTFDPDQQGMPSFVTVAQDAAVPVNLAGQFTIIPTAAQARCVLGQARVVADCRIGKGRALIIADAAVIEDDDGRAPPPVDVVKALVRETFEAP